STDWLENNYPASRPIKSSFEVFRGSWQWIPTERFRESHLNVWNGLLLSTVLSCGERRPPNAAERYPFVTARARLFDIAAGRGSCHEMRRYSLNRRRTSRRVWSNSRDSTLCNSVGTPCPGSH